MSATSARSTGPALLKDGHLLGMLLFIASESVFFLAVVIAYVMYRESGLALAREHLDLVRTAGFSVLLFSSSATIHVAVRRRDLRWLLATIALGTGFIAGQVTEYAQLFGEGIDASTGLFGTTFFTLTGLHGLHVLVGLGLLAGLFAAARSAPRRVSAVAWEAVSLYWHFVDVVWVVVFGVTYVWTFL